MANGIKIGNLDISAFKVGSADTKVYLGDTLLYPTTPPTPTGSTCYEIISTPITSYTSTTYDSVFSYYDTKWYMKNNLNQYEEYGIYDIVEDIASATTYEGKLGVVGTTEYQYSGGSWSIVGSYVDSSVTYTIDDTRPSPYVGQELSTTFKIPYADVETIGWVDLRIIDNNNGQLNIMLDTGGMTEYRYMGSSPYNGTVTNDGEYFYLSLPSEAPQSIVINSIDYWDSTPIHLIVGSKQATVEYSEKDIPLADVYDTVAEMEAVGCPTVGVSEYAFVGNDLYKYFANEQWNGVTYYNAKMVAFYENGNPLLVYENGSGDLIQAETKIRNVSPISVYIGDNVTSIGENAFYDGVYPTNNTISSVTFSDNSQLTSIGDYAFRDCVSLASIDIPSGVTGIGEWAFTNTPWWSTYSADTSHHYGNVIYINDVAYVATSVSITSCAFREGTVSIGQSAFQQCNKLTSITIPNSVTTIGIAAFRYCTSLTSVNIPSGITTIGNYTFQNCGFTSIDIPNSVTSIGDYAIGYCTSLTSISIPSGVTSIGEWAFAGCSGLTSITCLATTPPSLGGAAFYNTNNCPIYVPAASVSAYQSAWSSYASRIQAIP